jgi:hypothetical protein
MKRQLSTYFGQSVWSFLIIVDSEFSMNLWNRSTLPYVWWWYAVDNRWGILYRAHICLKSLLVKLVPLSVNTLSGHACLAIIIRWNSNNSSSAVDVRSGMDSGQLVFKSMKFIKNWDTQMTGKLIFASINFSISCLIYSRSLKDLR